jgi:hypothetical protein
MNVLFVMDRRVDAGSIQAICNYARAGNELGHRFALFGRPDSRFPHLRLTTKAFSFDYVVFVVESSLDWMDALRMPRLLREVPRERRAILDADGMYNEVIAIEGYDGNHISRSDCERWRRHYAKVSDTVLQPTLEPREPGAVALPFYGYDPGAVIRAETAPPKRFDILHVGHNWWRWRELSSELLPAIARARGHFDGICFIGSWWNGAPPSTPEHHQPAFRVEQEELRRLRIQVEPAVHYTSVTRAMSEGRINIMTQRPLFRRLRLFTSKYFEIFTADTIPLVLLDADHAQSVYGPAGRELALRGPIDEKLVDAISRPGRYRDIVEEVRAHLTRHHSYELRVQQLVTALRGMSGRCA